MIKFICYLLFVFSGRKSIKLFLMSLGKDRNQVAESLVSINALGKRGWEERSHIAIAIKNKVTFKSK